jgi:uracil-DNA glycosylase family 4
MTKAELELEAHVGAWGCCTKCDIGKYAANHVFFRGKLPCHLLVIGEAPGKDEDADGRPFVGRSGAMLNRWINHAVHDYMEQARRQSVVVLPRIAITNTLLCKPQNNVASPVRPPKPLELHNCAPRLDEFVRLSRARAIVAVGRHAEASCQATDWWGRKHRLFLYHPAYFMRPGPKPTTPERQAEELARFVVNAMLEKSQ